jgi:transposase
LPDVYFGAAKPHCVYLFFICRANRMKVLVHDGVGGWLAARRLHQRTFLLAKVELGAEQLQVLVLGLP